MPKAVIDRVNQFAEGQPTLMTFTDRHGNEIGDAEPTYEPDIKHEIPGVVAKTAQITGVEPEIMNASNGEETDLSASSTPPIVDTTAEPTVKQVDKPQQQQSTEFHNEFEPTRDDDEVEPEATAPTQPTQLVEPEQPRADEPSNEQAGTRRSSRNRTAPKAYVPSMKGKSYGYSATQLELEGSTFKPKIVEMIMTQLMLKAAIKTWGNEAKIAAEAEMKQLHWRNSFKPVRWSELGDKKKKTILESHIFLKQKRTGEIKGRTVAGGNKQRGFIDKEESSSPTVATESVILTSVVDALEERRTTVIDVPNAFIQTVVKDKNKRVIICIRGMLVNILVKIAPEVYANYVTVDKRGNKQLLVECLNALYGTMVASLLYYQKFTASLTEYGLTMNPYDPCVWNKTINGKQCTICFHVDD